MNKLDFDLAWKFVKKARTNYYLTKKKMPNCYYNNELEEEVLTIFSNLVNPGSNVTEEILDVKDEVLKTGGKMFIYLTTCPTQEGSLFKRIFQQSVTGIFISMKKIVEKSSDQDLADVGKKVLNELMTYLEFQYVTNIENSTFGMTKNLKDVKGSIITYSNILFFDKPESEVQVQDFNELQIPYWDQCF